MNKVEDSVIKYAIDFERYKNGQANEVTDMIDNANRSIAKYIRQTDSVYTKARYKEIAKKLNEVSKALKEKVGENIDIDGVIEYELKKQKKILDEAKPYLPKIKGGEINFLYPSLEQIKTAALFKPVDTKYGLTYQSYLEGIENGLYNIWDSAIRTGYLTGQSTQKIVSNVLGGLTPQTKMIKQGMINSYRNAVYANTRTVLQSFANETMNRVYEENEKYLGDTAPDGEKYKYEYLSTLDNRVCIICGELSGKLYKELKDVPQLPQHRGCRCVILPYLNIEGETRASKDGYIKDVTFDKWLSEQDVKTQKEVLGASRYQIYKVGQAEGKEVQFSNNGSVKNLPELMKEFDIVASPDTQQPVSGKNFSAQKWSEVYKDPYLTQTEKGAEYLLSQMKDSDELKKHLLETDLKNENLIETYKTYRIKGRGQSSIYTPERNELHKRMIDDYLLENTGAIVPKGETPKFVMLGGRGGSGKSMFNGIVYNPEKFIVIDPDLVKTWFKEYGYEERNASQFHIESSDVTQKLIKKAQKLNMNIVLDGTMSYLNSSVKMLQSFAEKGYYTEIDYMFLPPQISFERAMNRFVNGGKYNGRYVPMKVLLDMTENEKVFDVLKDFSNNWRFYSNYGIKKGDKPILISSKYT